MITLKQKKNISSQGGFVVLFAMLISTLILLISSGIYTVVEKQVVLASYSKESQKAFYTADSALDCALYYDLVPEKTVFPPEGGSYIPKNISCGGSNLTVSRVGNGSFQTGSTTEERGETFSYPYVFRYFGSERDKSFGCAYVLVEKDTDGGGLVFTRITAAGFNVCSNGAPDINNPTLVERRVSLSYKLNFSPSVDSEASTTTTP